MVILILAVFIFVSITVDLVIQYVRKKKSEVPVIPSVSTHGFNELSVSLPKGLSYDKTHTWVFMEKSGNIKIGLSDFLLRVTGRITNIEMKDVGEKVKKGYPVVSLIQNGKKLHINAPISGTIKSQNLLLSKDLEIVSSSPYKNGWIYSIEPSNWLRDSGFLIKAEKYREWLRSEFSRLKDFLSISMESKNIEYNSVVLQDGGQLKEYVLEEMEPDVWEDFQELFLNI